MRAVGHGGGFDGSNHNDGDSGSDNNNSNNTTKNNNNNNNNWHKRPSNTATRPRSCIYQLIYAIK